MASDFRGRTPWLPPHRPVHLPVPRREGERGGPAAAPGYRDLLDAAYELGRADGRLAAALEPGGPPDPTGACCRGRDRAAFARYLWGRRPGPVPAGLELNAPLWYVAGLTEELTTDRAR